MKKENLFTSLALSLLPCEQPRNKEHRCRSQMMRMDTRCSNVSLPLYKHSLFSPAVVLWAQRLFGLMSRPLQSISNAVTDNFRLLDGLEKHLRHFYSHVSVFTLCMNSSSVVRLSFSSGFREQPFPGSLNLKSTDHIFNRPVWFISLLYSFTELMNKVIYCKTTCTIFKTAYYSEGLQKHIVV